MSGRSVRLPPTFDASARGDEVPYFLWWTDVTLDRFKQLVRHGPDDDRAYWLGALLREANTRDVWSFTTPDEIRALWPKLLRHLGRTRQMWSHLLRIGPSRWPPAQAFHAHRA